MELEELESKILEALSTVRDVRLQRYNLKFSNLGHQYDECVFYVSTNVGYFEIRNLSPFNVDVKEKDDGERHRTGAND